MSNWKNSKMYDLFNKKEWEVKWSFGISVLILAFFIYINLYHDFFAFQEMLNTLIICLIGAMIGLLGFSLSGIAIIVSLFSRRETKSINLINGENAITRILSSYSFLAKNIGMQCFVLIAVYFLISSRLMIAPIILFYILVLIETYHIVFIVLYTVALVQNCIELYKIKNIYSEIESAKKTIHDEANEIKIDYIFSTLVNNYGCSTEEVLNKLIVFVSESKIENKDKIIEYIKNQYNLL